MKRLIGINGMLISLFLFLHNGRRGLICVIFKVFFRPHLASNNVAGTGSELNNYSFFKNKSL